MARWEDDPQGDGRSDADRGACTSDGEQVNWLGVRVRGRGAGGISHIQKRDASPSEQLRSPGPPRCGAPGDVGFDCTIHSNIIYLLLR
jgi:hypothetical protein